MTALARLMKRRRVTVALLVSAVGVMCLVRGDSMAQPVPPNVSFQGILTDAAGVPVDGFLSITFRLYEGPDATEAAWEELQTGILLQDGAFNVVLGETSPIEPHFLASEELYLGIQVEGDSELSPRVLVSSVPYALRAQESEVAQRVVDGGVPSGMIAMFDAACPVGWTRVDALDGRFPRGAETYGGTGGRSTHDHSVAAHGHPGSSTGGWSGATSRWTGDTSRGGAHSHTASHSHSGPSHRHQASAAMSCSDGGSRTCWRVDADDRVRSAGTGATSTWSGSTSSTGAHTHTANHAHNIPSHSHSVTIANHGATATGGATVLPPYLDVVFCRRD